jgi:hypothetical protein
MYLMLSSGVVPMEPRETPLPLYGLFFHIHLLKSPFTPAVGYYYYCGQILKLY